MKVNMVAVVKCNSTLSILSPDTFQMMVQYVKHKCKSKLSGLLKWQTFSPLTSLKVKKKHWKVTLVPTILSFFPSSKFQFLEGEKSSIQTRFQFYLEMDFLLTKSSVLLQQQKWLKIKFYQPPAVSIIKLFHTFFIFPSAKTIIKVSQQGSKVQYAKWPVF